MDQRPWRELIDLYALGELPPEAAAQVEARLAADPSGQRDLAAARRLVETLNRELAEPKPAPDLADRVLARLAPADEKPIPTRRSRRRRSVWAAAAVAACAIVAVMVWLLLAPESGDDVPGGGQPVAKTPGPDKAHGGGAGPPRAIAPAAGCRVEPIGPADYQLLGPRRVRLGEGRLDVRIDRRTAGAAPFVVETPAGEAQAVGTRFVVETASLASDAHPPPSEQGDPAMSPNSRGVRFLTRVFILAGVVQLTSAGDTISGASGEVLGAETGAAPTKHVANLAARFAQYYQPVEIDVKPSIPAYRLPLSRRQVENWDAVVEKLSLDKATPRLVQNGFVVVPISHLPHVANDDMVKPYSTLRRMEIPIFVTADTLLHLYHVQFDESLKDIEQREFYPQLAGLSRMLVGELGQAYASCDGPAMEKEALKKAWTFSAVGLKCLEPDWAPPPPIAADVAVVIDKIDKHEGFWPPRGAAGAQWPLFRYGEDFSQYVPRGHYTRSEALKRYFRAMMWYGRMTFLLKGEDPHGAADQPALVSLQEAQTQTLAAAHLARLLGDGKLPDGQSAEEVWQRIYTVTAFYVGLADDLGLPEYDAAISKVLSASKDVAGLVDPGKFRAVQVELARFSGQAIYGGTGNVITYRGDDPDALVDALDKTAGFRLMGQRFIPDSYVMGKLVFPTVGRPRQGHRGMFTYVVSEWGPIRGFPRGLDVMAWRGSHRARHWLAQLEDDAYGVGNDWPNGDNLRYDAVLEGLSAEFDALSAADWNRNVYWSWLYSLKGLLEEYGEGYPTFMTTAAWQDKSMNTALASWIQLRHDTILYAKQSYAMTGESAFRPNPVEGYVEPVPEFYAHLLATTRMTLAGLKEMDVLQPQAIERLEKLEEITARLLEISKKELANQELTQEDYDFIRYFGSRLERIQVSDPELAKAAREASESRDYQRAQELFQEPRGDKPMKTTLVADVHTDGNTKQVLEEATGYVDLVVTCYLQPDGRLVLGAGPVLSYYEFKHPMDDRLTDEAWREMLGSGKAPDQPEWTKTYRAD